MSKEQANKVFNKTDKADLKEYKLSAALEEITDPMKIINTDLLKPHALFSSLTEFSNFGKYCELYIQILEEDKKSNEQLITDIETIRSVYAENYVKAEGLISCMFKSTKTEGLISHISKEEYQSIKAYIQLYKRERQSEISEEVNNATTYLENACEEMPAGCICYCHAKELKIVLKEIEAYIYEKVKERIDDKT